MKDCYVYETCRLRIAKAWDECPDDCADYVPEWAVAEEAEEADRMRNQHGIDDMEWDCEMAFGYEGF